MDTARPRVLPFVAGLIALAGAILTVVSVFSDYYEDFPATRRIPGELWLFLLYALGVAAAALLLVTRRHSQAAGATALVVFVTLFAGERTLGVYNVSLAERGGGPGFTFDLAGFALVIVAAVLASIGVVAAGDLDTTRAEVTSGRAGLAALAAVTGFVTAVGFGLNPARLAVDVPGSFGQGSPLLASPRSLWAQLLVVIGLTVWPVIAVLARRTIAAGVTLGVLTFVAAEAGYRVLSATATILGRDPGIDAIEGTWVFLIGAIALTAVLGARLVVPEGAVRQIPAGGDATAA